MNRLNEFELIELLEGYDVICDTSVVTYYHTPNDTVEFILNEDIHIRITFDDDYVDEIHIRHRQTITTTSRYFAWNVYDFDEKDRRTLGIKIWNENVIKAMTLKKLIDKL